MKKNLFKKMTTLAVASSMVMAIAMTTNAAESWDTALSFNFSNSDGLISTTVANWTADNAATITKNETATGINDGVFVAGSEALIATKTFDGSKGFKLACDVTWNDAPTGETWWQSVLLAFNAKGIASEFTSPTGTQFTTDFKSYSVNFKGNGINFQAHVHDISAEGKALDSVDGKADGHFWGGDFSDNLSTGEKHSVEMIVLPKSDTEVTVTMFIDGTQVDFPNATEVFPNNLSDEMVLMIGDTQYNNMASGVYDNVKVYTVGEGGVAQTDADANKAPVKTGDDFIALTFILSFTALAAVIVLKKKTVVE